VKYYGRRLLAACTVVRLYKHMSTLFTRIRMADDISIIKCEKLNDQHDIWHFQITAINLANIVIFVQKMPT